MRYALICIGLIMLLLTCRQRSELMKNSWLVVDGTYEGQPIDFHSTDLIKFSDRYGNEIRSLNFSKDGTISLPGINSPNISAKWVIEEGLIRFYVDSTRYSIYDAVNTDLSFLDTSDSVSYQQEGNSELKQKIINPLTTIEFNRAMEIYGQPFDYYISQDTLTLLGNKGRIRAIQDRTIDELFRNL